MAREGSFEVRFHHRVEVVFDYLADPARRPEWQSSLRRIEPLTAQTSGVGARWRDVTAAGIRPELSVVEHDRPRRWAEEGRWRGITAYLSLAFTPRGEQTEAVVTFRMDGTGPYVVIAATVARLAPMALRRDLARADRQMGTSPG
jgi:hypothetical protein